MSTPLRIGVCGTTENTVTCVEALYNDPRFEVLWVVTPTPRPIGRKQTLTPSPLDTWAQEKGLQVWHVEKNLKPLQETLLTAPAIDYLLVVDFGYIVPQWLIDIPSICPINIHPSDLPKYRGSSPGQYVILYGEHESAVTIMRLTAGLDEGPIIAALPFELTSDETQTSYYKKAFALAHEALPDTLFTYATTRLEVEQPIDSPTPIAKRFTREDGYIPYSLLEQFLSTSELLNAEKCADALGDTLHELLTHQPLSLIVLLDRALRAFTPWPGVWTLVPSYKERDNVRLKILNVDVASRTITAWQFDGESAKSGTLHL